MTAATVFADRNIRTALSADGVLVATIDMPGRAVNVFSSELMDSLEGVLDAVEHDGGVRAIVFASAKPTFLAGADLEMVEKFTERAKYDSHAELHALCGRLGRLFVRLEAGSTPAVAAINGLALGGGFELALACHARVLTDDAQVGLPEIKLGLLPGAGGTQRLPRLIGTKVGLQMLLDGEPITAPRAKELGIADDVVAGSQLLDAARRRASLLASQSPPDTARSSRPPAANPYDFSRDGVFDVIAADNGLSVEDRAHYPAYHAIMSCVSGGWGKPVDAGSHWEMDCFVRLIQDPVAGNMVRSLFLDRQRAAKQLGRALDLRPQLALSGSPDESLRALLTKARIEVISREQLPDGGIVLSTTSAAPPSDPRVVELAWLRAGSSANAAGVWVSNTSNHGRAIEICIAKRDEPAERAGLTLARWLRATPLVSRGTSLLMAMQTASESAAQLSAEDRLLATALAAARVWDLGGIEDTRLADSAAVIAGLHPPYTGGPFCYLGQHTLESLSAHASRASANRPELFAIPARLSELCGVARGARNVIDTRIA